MTTPITTTAQLEALPEQTPIRDRFGDVGIVQAGKVHYPETAPQTFERTIKKYAPLTVLHVPGQSPDPSPTVLALAQALATRDGEGTAFTSQTKSESTARIVSRYIGEAEDIAAHLPASRAPECKIPAQDLQSHEAMQVPTDLVIGACARCGKPVLVPRTDPRNHEMELCPSCTHEVCHSVPAPTVKPGRDEVAKAIYDVSPHFHLDGPPWTPIPFEDPDEFSREPGSFIGGIYEAADAVLAILPGQTVAEVRAEALRDAADRVPVSRGGWRTRLLALADEEAGK